MDIQCKKCPYFGKVKEKLQKGHIVLGFCRLRQRHITDTTINQSQCKDRAIIMLDAPAQHPPAEHSPVNY